MHYVAGAILVITGGLVLLKRGLAPYVRPFLFLVAVNLFGIAAGIIESSQVPALWVPGYIMLYVFVAFLPFAWYALASRWGVDATERPRMSGVLFYFFLGLSCIAFVYFWITGSIDLVIVNQGWFLDLGTMYFWLSAFLIVSVTAGAYAIEVCYRSSLGLARERIKRSFFPLLAYAISLLGVATVAVLYGRVGDLVISITFTLFALVSVPASRHFILFDPSNDGIILTRRGVYSSLVVVLFGIYFLIIGAVGEFLVKYNLDEGMFFSLAVLLLMVITFIIFVASQAIRSRFKVDPSPGTPFRAKSPYAAEWKEFAEEVSVTLEMDAIYSRTGELLRRLLKIDHCLFVIKEPAPSINYTLYCGDGIDRGIPAEKLDRLCDWLSRIGHPVELPTLREKAPEESDQIDIVQKAASFEIFLLVPFIARQQPLGFWGISAHTSGRPLSSDEIAFIEAASNPVALTILAARMTDEIMISREIDSFHRFSSFVLHDLKNSVAMLSMLMQNAEKNMSNPEFQKEAVLTIAKAVNRQKKIISRLTEEKTEDKLSLEEVNLSALIYKTLERLRIETIKSIETTVDVDNNVVIIADTAKIGSVFDNLVMNAIEAMPDGGKLTIATRPSDSHGVVAVSFADTGPGMEQEFISTRLFKPFASTKPHGLGIGMFQSREIIMAHRGRIEVNSEPGKGAEFVIYLPGEYRRG
jgi:putative PEP-CTERM system histidine kinase